MAWVLQPKSYSQAIHRNAYNVAYRRTGAYKGMGQDPSTDGTGDGTAPCLTTGSMGPLNTAAGQVWCETGTGVPPVYPYGTTPTAAPATLGDWIGQYMPLIAIGGLILLLTSRR